MTTTGRTTLRMSQINDGFSLIYELELYRHDGTT